MIFGALSRSLALRFSAAMLVVAFVSLACFATAAILRFNQGLATQAIELKRLSSQKLSERLDGDVRLARARLERQFSQKLANIADIARRSEVRKAVASGNVVAMAEFLAPLRKFADVDGILVVNAQGQVIGADAMETDIVTANLALSANPIFEKITILLATSQRDSASGSVQVVPLRDAATRLAVGAAIASAVGQIITFPVFDDFGELTGALIAHRGMRPQEPQLTDFSKLSGIGLVLLNGVDPISVAGMPNEASYRLSQLDPHLLMDASGQFVARCIEFDLKTKLCAFLPRTELTSLANEMALSGENQGRALVRWLIGYAILVFAAFGLTAAIVTRAVVGPLSAITSAVLALSRGDWRAPVLGARRGDEVGAIARSVLTLQDSIEERDRLRDERLLQNDRLLQQEARLTRQNLLFTTALENMGQGLCMLDADQRVAVLNDQFKRMFAIPNDSDVEGLTAHQLKRRIRDRVARQNFARLARRHLGSIASEGADALNVEMNDGRTIAVSRRTMDDGGSVATFADVSDRKRDEHRINYMACHDSLTGLLNRTQLNEALDTTLRSGDSGVMAAVMFLDLDRFKVLNDSLGHGAGDMVLRAASLRMQACAGSLDTIARFGGDEFVLVQTDARDLACVERLASRLIENISEPYVIEGRTVEIGVTIGIALAHVHDSSPDGLLRKADLALYRAKKVQRGSYLIFDPEMDAQEAAKRAIELDLKLALERNELSLAFQPIIDAVSGAVVCFEALLRWRHPTRGPISPAEFIPIAEELGLILQIGDWVLRQACVAAVNWPSSISVAINVSPLQIKSGGFELSVMRAIMASGLSAKRLNLEITESIFLERNDQTLATLHELRRLGVACSMDDFGIGYSSLSALGSFPFDTLKIDRSFVQDLEAVPQNRHIIRATCQLARALGITSLAEGVETQGQADFLIECGCEQLQGYFYGKPMPLQDATTFIERNQLQLGDSAQKQEVAA